MEKSVFALYLHENMLSFFTDIDDVAECLDTYSLNDNITSQLTYCFNVNILISWYNQIYRIKCKNQNWMIKQL